VEAEEGQVVVVEEEEEEGALGGRDFIKMFVWSRA